MTDPEVIETFEELLADARAGKIRLFAYSYLSDTDHLTAGAFGEGAISEMRLLSDTVESEVDARITQAETWRPNLRIVDE